MVLSWTAANSRSKSTHMFSGEGGINMFFFYFENISGRGKDENEKVFQFMVHLDGPAFEYFFQRFTKNASISTKFVNFGEVKDAVVDEFNKRDTQEETTHRTMEETLDKNDFIKSMKRIDAL